MKGDGDLRMLGVRDGLASALVHLRCQTMASLKQERQRLDPRHVRKIAENERRLGPLLKLDRWLEIQVGEVDKAYKKTREIGCEGEGSSQPYEMGHI
jgi:hypothetical protein